MSRTMRVAVVVCVVGLLANPILADRTEALSENVTIQFSDTPLSEALQMLAKSHEIPIRLDQGALADMGLRRDEPISFPAQGVTLKSMLKLMLEPLKLAAIVGPDGVVEVTTAAKARRHFESRTYDLTAITGLNAEGDEAILNILIESVDGLWVVRAGEGGQASINRDTLVVEQTADVHERIADLLAQMTAIINPNQPSPPLTTKQKNEQALRDRLTEPVTLKWRNVEFDDAMSEFGKLLGGLVFVNSVAIRKSKDNRRQPMTIDAKDQPLGEVLDSVLVPRSLSWVIEDEVVKITTKVEAEDVMVTRVYDVRRKVPTSEDAQRLIDKLVHADFATWEDMDGIGGTLNVLDGMLIVKQHRAAHEKVAEMLKSL